MPQIHATGAELVVIGNGSPEQARWFVEDSGVRTPVYTDPARAVYSAVGARSGTLTLLHPGDFLNRLRALTRGFRQSKTRGSAVQQGGVFVVMPDGSVPYRFLARASGDRPSPGTVLDALRMATSYES